MDAALVQAALEAAREHGIPATETWSGAGHDAQHVTALAPALLLFVPLHGGESHTPQEGADMDEIVAAARVVVSVLRRPAQRPATLIAADRPHRRRGGHTSVQVGRWTKLSKRAAGSGPRALDTGPGCERTVSSGGATRNRRRAVVHAMIRGESTPRRLRLPAASMSTISALRRAGCRGGRAAPPRQKGDGAWLLTTAGLTRSATLDPSWRTTTSTSCWPGASAAASSCARAPSSACPPVSWARSSRPAAAPTRSARRPPRPRPPPGARPAAPPRPPPRAGRSSWPCRRPPPRSTRSWSATPADSACSRRPGSSSPSTTTSC